MFLWIWHAHCLFVIIYLSLISGIKRKERDWEENDYYDSDEDTFLDRTGSSVLHFMHLVVCGLLFTMMHLVVCALPFTLLYVVCHSPCCMCSVIYLVVCGLSFTLLYVLCHLPCCMWSAQCIVSGQCISFSV